MEQAFGMKGVKYSYKIQRFSRLSKRVLYQLCELSVITQVEWNAFLWKNFS